MPRLSPVDQAFFLLETHDRPMSIGLLVVLKPPPGTRGNFADRLLRTMLKCPPGPPFSYRVKPGPLPGLLSLVEDPHMDPAQQVFRHKLPRGADLQALFSELWKIHPKRLRRDAPLWEAHFFTGFPGGRVALYFKTHHGLIDGIGFINRRERTLNIMFHQPVDNIVFSPRMDYMFKRNKELGTLPPKYQAMEELEFFDKFDCSPRPYAYYGPCLEITDSSRVKREAWISVDNEPFKPMEIPLGNLFETSVKFLWEVFPPPRGEIIECAETPYGTLEKRVIYTQTAHHTTKYPIESPDDIRAMKYILDGRTACFNLDRFNLVGEQIGQRTAPMLDFPRANAVPASRLWASRRSPRRTAGPPPCR